MPFIAAYNPVILPVAKPTNLKPIDKHASWLYIRQLSIPWLLGGYAWVAVPVWSTLGLMLSLLITTIWLFWLPWHWVSRQPNALHRRILWLLYGVGWGIGVAGMYMCVSTLLLQPDSLWGWVLGGGMLVEWLEHFVLRLVDGKLRLTGWYQGRIQPELGGACLRVLIRKNTSE